MPWYEHRFCYICLFRFPTKKEKKLVHNGGYYFFFFIENTLVIFVCLFVFFLGHHLFMAHKGIREEFLEELGEASLCLHETCPIAG